MDKLKRKIARKRCYRTITATPVRVLVLVLLFALPFSYYVLIPLALLPVRRWLMPKYSKLDQGAAATKGLALKTTCKSHATLGGGIGKREGSWTICLDDDRLVQRMKTNECVVYSFGVRDDWSFDSAIARLGCTVYAFDPSIHRKASDLDTNVHFEPFGIGAKDEMSDPIVVKGGPWNGETQVWTMKTLQTLMAHHGHTHIDVLKMDVEGGEWGPLAQLAAIPTSIGQIVMEVHFSNSELRPGTVEDEEQEISTLMKLHQEGYLLWNRVDNEQGFERDRTFLRGQGSCCYDTGWLGPVAAAAKVNRVGSG